MGVVGTSCGNMPPPSQPKSESSGSPTDEAREPSKLDTASNSEPVETEVSPDPQPPARATADDTKTQRPLEQLCSKIAARAVERCSKRVAEFYATNCRRYAKATKCEDEITRVLECQVKTPDELLCAHQADPNCTEVNHQLLACDKGKVPIEQTRPEDLTLPSGWAKIQDTKLGFTVAMPNGATLEENGTRRTWKAEEGGLAYLVETAEAPVGKPTSGALLRTIMKYLGNRCQLQLKVRGEFELKGVTVVQYESGCKDGSVWRGMMHVWNGNAVSTGFHGPKGSRGVLEPYFYSFDVSH
jgi:hypothetical protein